MSRILALLALLPLVAVASQEPSFSTGDLADLSCKVVKEAPGKNGSLRLQIEVSNSSRLSAEPLEFHLRQVPRKKTKDQQAFELDTARAVFPFANRFGRAVPPKGKQRYWLQTAVWGKDDVDFELNVTRACWFDGEGVPQPAITVGKPTQVDQTSFDGSKLQVSRVRVDNPLAVSVDAVFLAKTRQPRDEQVLLGVRLPPGGTEWLISGIGSKIEFEQVTPSQTVRVEKLELVDWCLLGAGDPALAAQKLEPAYRAWLRWSEPYPGLRGRLQYSQQTYEGIDRSAMGTFVFDPSGNASAEFLPGENPGLDPESLRGLGKDAAVKLRHAFADLRRESWETLQAKNRLREVAEAAVEIDGSGFAPKGTPLDVAAAAHGDPEQTMNLSVAGDVIVSSGDRGNFRCIDWTGMPLGDGYVITQRRTPAGDWCYQYAYELLEGRPVPRGYREAWATVAGELLRQDQLLLTGLSFDDGLQAAAPAPPGGEGAAGLRAAWENGYRYPAERHNLSAKFEVHTPGTDMTWQGLRELTGSLELGGFRGFMMGSGSWQDYAAKFSSPMSPGQQRSLAFAFFDRLIMWGGRDFNGRADFDTQFAGCRIAAATPEGKYVIEGGTIVSVGVREGRVDVLTNRSGGERRFTWTRVGDTMVMTRARCGLEDLTAKFAAFNGVIVPVEFEFKAVFGPQWGPEQIRFSDVKLK